jgi:hypothetical protein
MRGWPRGRSCWLRRGPSDVGPARQSRGLEGHWCIDREQQPGRGAQGATTRLPGLPGCPGGHEQPGPSASQCPAETPAPGRVCRATSSTSESGADRPSKVAQARWTLGSWKRGRKPWSNTPVLRHGATWAPLLHMQGGQLESRPKGRCPRARPYGSPKGGAAMPTDGCVPGQRRHGGSLG